jgi:Domain of unknown function (DUF4167)
MTGRLETATGLSASPAANNGGNPDGMRPSNKQRSRNKPGNNGGGHNNPRRNNMGNIINRVFESAGPDGKVRGTPQQIIDKYQALARDAQVSGDRVAAESYLQHSEHYSRLLGEAQRQQQEARVNQEQRDEGQRDDGFDMQRRPQPGGHPAGSGLTMIDADDDELSGPIETPEGRRTRMDEPAPVVRIAPQPAPEPARAEAAPAGGDQGEDAAASAETQDEAAPARRSRPRRRPRTESPAEPAQPAE